MGMKVKLGKYARSVSIIGVGATPFGNVMETSGIKDFTERELFAMAAHQAMREAGVDGADIDALVYGSIGSAWFTNQMSPQNFIHEWVGMRGKPVYHHEEACATGYAALDHAIQAVASGKHNIVMMAGSEINRSWNGPVLVNASAPAHVRIPTTRNVQMSGSQTWPYHRVFPTMLHDLAYGRWDNATCALSTDQCLFEYMRKYKISLQQIDDVLNMATLANRRNAALNPNSLLQKDPYEEAKENGFNNIMDYLRSPANPQLLGPTRKMGFCNVCDGASAVIVCPTDMARQFKQQPIEVLGIGSSCYSMTYPKNIMFQYKEAFRQVLEFTKIKSEDIDFFMTTDMAISEQVTTPEACGYIPEGQAWKYILEGRTAFDGDKPINTNGGATAMGHTWAAAGGVAIAEAVWQMRGQAGARQVKKLPETSFVRGEGGGQLTLAYVLRTLQ